MYLNSLTRLRQWVSEPFCSLILEPKLIDAVSHSRFSDLCILINAPPVPERWPPFHGKGLCLKSLIIVGGKAVWLHRTTGKIRASEQVIADGPTTERRFRLWKIEEKWGRIEAERVPLPEVVERNLASVLNGNIKQMVCHEFLEALLVGTQLSRVPLTRKFREGEFKNPKLRGGGEFSGPAFVRFFTRDYPQLSHSALRLAQDLYISKLGTGPVTVATFDQLAGLYYYTSHYHEWKLTVQ